MVTGPDDPAQRTVLTRDLTPGMVLTDEHGAGCLEVRYAERDADGSWRIVMATTRGYLTTERVAATARHRLAEPYEAAAWREQADEGRRVTAQVTALREVEAMISSSDLVATALHITVTSADLSALAEQLGAPVSDRGILSHTWWTDQAGQQVTRRHLAASLTAATPGGEPQ